jgi:hypothetical protein
MFSASDAEVEPVLLDSPALTLSKPLALGRWIAPCGEDPIRRAVVRSLGDDGVVNNGSFRHVVSILRSLLPLSRQHRTEPVEAAFPQGTALRNPTLGDL